MVIVLQDTSGEPTLLVERSGSQYYTVEAMLFPCLDSALFMHFFTVMVYMHRYPYVSISWWAADSDRTSCFQFRK